MDTQFKTSSYQRRANKNYLERIKSNPEAYEQYKQRLKENQKKYYQKNKEKILARKQAERDALKGKSSGEESE
jgi:hypothetical protein